MIMELSITFRIVRNFGLTPCICCRRISQRRAIQKKRSVKSMAIGPRCLTGKQGCSVINGTTKGKCLCEKTFGGSETVGLPPGLQEQLTCCRKRCLRKNESSYRWRAHSLTVY